MEKVTVIGGGFAGLSAACYVAKAGYEVTLHEKNSTTGGRARHFSENGFVFDMGPSWYWMPDVFERFFNDFGRSATDYYDLVQLDPGFQVFFGDGQPLPVPADPRELYALFEGIEKGSAARLKAFLTDAAYKYRAGMEELVYRPGLSVTEFFNYRVVKGLFRSHLFTSVSSHVRKYFNDERLVKIMELPVLFLGAMPDNIPALYTLMNYAALEMGTWYPMGGMHRIVSAMTELAQSLGVTIHTNSEIAKVVVASNRVKGVSARYGFEEADAVIASGDYHHIEHALLEPQYRNYEEKYWNSKTFAPSCLVYYLGVSKKIKNLLHHNLFFDSDFEQHSREIYQHPAWPQRPLFYVCCPSKTDNSVAPAGHENLFVLIPVAAGLEDTDEIREHYFTQVMSRIELECNESISPYVVYKRTYCINDFVKDYHAYKGNAYGLANTLRQTAILKPSIRNKKLNNLIYAGQLTVPGPGVPPALISGKLAAQQAIKTTKRRQYETSV